MCTQTVLMGVKPVNVCVCMSVQTLALKKLRCEPCVTHLVSVTHSMPTHYCISDAESGNEPRLPQSPKAV